MVAPVVKAVLKPGTGSEVYAMIREACALAREGCPGPVFVEVPANLYLAQHRFDAGKGSSPGASGGRSGARGGGVGEEVDPEAVARVADLIGKARRPLIYVGAGAAASRDQLLALAERLEAPVSTTYQGKGVFPETHPLFLWPGFGDAAPPFVRDVVSSCDLTLAIGCRFSEVGTGSYGLVPPGPLVHVDIDPEVPGRNYPAEVEMVADAGAFLRALLGVLPRSSHDDEGGDSSGSSGPDAELRATVASGHADVWDQWQRQEGEGGVSPPYLLRTLQELMGPDTIFTTDSGNGTFLAVECLRLNQPGKLLAPIDYSCMGYSVPAALGAKLARPECPVVALAGDGAFLMTGLETLTGAREGLGVIVMVLRDRELAQIAQLQETALNRKAQSELPDFALEALARGMGVPYSRMETDDQVEEVIKGAVVVAEQGTPVLVEVKIDYSEKTYFTRGVVKTNLLRLPMKERVRFIGRAVKRRFLG
jgi:acetolactate synthase-1/2/3 large subunit